MNYRVNVLLRMKPDLREMEKVHPIAFDGLPAGVGVSLAGGDIHYTVTATRPEIEKLLVGFIGPMCVRYLNAIESVAIAWKPLDQKGGERL